MSLGIGHNMEIYEVVALILIAIGAFLYQGFKKHYMNMLTKWLEKWFKDKFKGEDISKEFSEIQERMVELKTILEADRVVIDQFHNGSNFTNQKPLWKVTRTYEICSSGVSYESLKIQNVMAVLLWDSITAIFDIKNRVYYEQLNGHLCPNGCKNPYGIYKYYVDLMPESIGKVLLRNQGIESFLQIPLIYENNVFGYVGIHYLDDIPPIDDVCKICQKSQEIAYFLNRV